LWQKAGDWLQQKVLQPVQRGWNALTHPGQSLENALVQWGTHSPTGYNVIRGLASMTASMNDPERNPVTAAFGQALRDGIAGFSYGVRSTIDLARRTGSSLLKGDWEGVRRYGGALLEGTVKGWIWGSIQTVGHLAWGVIKTVTPIGLFETVPAWMNALQEARAGKRGGWDVALTSLFLMANLIGIAGGVNGIQTANEFRTFPDSLSPAAQSQYISLSTIEQIKVFNAVRSTGASPAAVEFYLEQTARPGSPLADLPLADALRVSALAAESGRGAFILDYIGRYGVTDALRLAPPEVIRGMTNESILVQTQEMLSQNTGYNVSPESWFGKYSAIGRDGTYITNEAAIKSVIGEFQGRGTIKITEAQAIRLEQALGLEPKSLFDGFRISRIVNIRDLNPSYPVQSLSPLFLGPGKGLPGGGPELKLTPSIPMDSPYIIEQIIVEVIR
jgi:hypothetical protein